MFDNKGEIYRLELEKNVGFTFVKVLYLHGGYIILTPLDILIKDPTDIDLSGIEKTAPFCYDLLPLMNPPTRGKWKKVKDFEVDTNRQFVPDFKNNLSTQSWHHPYWHNIKSWYLVRDLFPNGWRRVAYKQVSHLGMWQHSAPDLIRTKLTMFWLKKLGKNIKRIYKGEMDDNNYFWNLSAYYETLNLTFYSGLEPALWNQMKPGPTPRKKKKF